MGFACSTSAFLSHFGVFNFVLLIILRLFQAGCTAVHLAAKYGRMDTIRFLADKRADILLVNDYKGISPDLYSNSKYKSNQIRKIIEEYTNTSQAEVEVTDGAAGSNWGFSYSNPRRSKFLR
jgi:ankyrin repeat protein